LQDITRGRRNTEGAPTSSHRLVSRGRRVRRQGGCAAPSQAARHPLSPFARPLLARQASTMPRPWDQGSVLGGDGEQCLAFPQVAGGTDLPVEGSTWVSCALASARWPAAIGCLQSGERRVGLRPDLVVQVGCPLELSGSNLESWGRRDRAGEPPIVRIGGIGAGRAARTARAAASWLRPRRGSVS
jgi:hypothetical protein